MNYTWKVSGHQWVVNTMGSKQTWWLVIYRYPDLQMSCSDLTKRRGTGLIYPIMATRAIWPICILLPLPSPVICLCSKLPSNVRGRFPQEIRSPLLCMVGSQGAAIRIHQVSHWARRLAWAHLTDRNSRKVVQENGEIRRADIYKELMWEKCLYFLNN